MGRSLASPRAPDPAKLGQRLGRWQAGTARLCHGTTSRSCRDGSNVDLVTSEAEDQYAGGLAESALALVARALVCKQSDEMVRLATMYACVAHDLISARRYFSKLGPPFQAAIAQRCQQEDLNVRGP